MQRWKLIIIFTRPRDNYRPTVPEEFVDGVSRQEREMIDTARKEGRKEHFGAIHKTCRKEAARKRPGEGGGTGGEVIELAGLASQPC